MKKFIPLLALLLFASNLKLHAQDFQDFTKNMREYKEEVKCENNKCQVINQDGKVILDNYQDICYKKTGTVSEFFAKKNDKWGVINENNEILLNFDFDNYENRYENYLVVEKNGKKGLLKDITYNQILPFEFDYIATINDGNIIATKEGKNGLFSPQGEQLLPFAYDNIQSSREAKRGEYIVTNQGKTGVVNTKGEVIVPLKYDYIMHEGCAIVTKYEGKQGLCDTNGKEIYKPKYRDITVSCEEGMATLETNPNKWFNHFFSKEAEKEFKKFREDFNKPYNNSDDVTPVEKAGIAVVQKFQGKYIFVDKDGRQLNDNLFDNVVLNNEIDRINTTQSLEYLNNVAKVTDCDGKFIVIKDNKYGLVDKNGKTLIDPQYRIMRGHKKDQFAAFIGDEYGVIDKNNNIIVPFSKESEYSIVNNKNEKKKEEPQPEQKVETQTIVIKPKEYHIASLKYDEKTYYGFVNDNSKISILDKNGFEVDEGVLYDSICAIGASEKYGYLKAKIGDKYTIFDKDGNKLFTLTAEDIKKHSDTEYFIVKTNEGLYTYNKQGTKIEQEPFIDYSLPQFVPSKYEKFATIIGTNNKKGLLDKNGKIILKPIYDDFYFDFPLVITRINNNFGYYNVDTKAFSDCQYDSVKDLYYGNYDRYWLFYKDGNKTEIRKY